MQDSETQHVYIGEAYRDGERIERVVHTTEDGAWEDIEVLAGDEADHLVVDTERVYRGAEVLQ